MVPTTSPDAFHRPPPATSPRSVPITSAERDFVKFVAKLSNHELGRMVQKTQAWLNSRPDVSYLWQARRERLAYEDRLCAANNCADDLMWDTFCDLDRYIEWAWAETQKCKPTTVTSITKISVSKPTESTRRPTQVQSQASPSLARSEPMSSTTLHFRVSNYGPPTGYKSPFGNCGIPDRVIEVQETKDAEPITPSAETSQEESSAQALEEAPATSGQVKEPEANLQDETTTSQEATSEAATTECQCLMCTYGPAEPVSEPVSEPVLEHVPAAMPSAEQIISCKCLVCTYGPDEPVEETTTEHVQCTLCTLPCLLQPRHKDVNPTTTFQARTQ